MPCNNSANRLGFQYLRRAAHSTWTDIQNQSSSNRLWSLAIRDTVKDRSPPRDVLKFLWFTCLIPLPFLTTGLSQIQYSPNIPSTVLMNLTSTCRSSKRRTRPPESLMPLFINSTVSAPTLLVKLRMLWSCEDNAMSDYSYFVSPRCWCCRKSVVPADDFLFSEAVPLEYDDIF